MSHAQSWWVTSEPVSKQLVAVRRVIYTARSRSFNTHSIFIATRRANEKSHAAQPPRHTHTHCAPARTDASL